MEGGEKKVRGRAGEQIQGPYQLISKITYNGLAPSLHRWDSTALKGWWEIIK